MPEQKFIEIRGAREHNLKSIDIDIPRDRLVVITGLSGSGKSSLAFDTIYAEGQRRYVESLSAYARQFLDMMQKPDVDHIAGLSPGDLDRAEDHLEEPALDRRHRHRDLRLPAAAVRPRRHALLAGDRPADRGAAGQPDGRHHHGAARGHARLPAGADRPRPQGRVPQGIRGPAQAGLPAGQGQRRVPRPRRAARARQEVPPQHRRRRRPRSSCARASRPGSPTACAPRSTSPTASPSSRRAAADETEGEEPQRITFSEKFACPVSGFTIPEIEPRLFSFNAPYGACPACDGLGVELVLRPAADRAGRGPDAACAARSRPGPRASRPTTRQTHRGAGQALRLRPDEALARPAGAGAAGAALRLGGREDPLPLRRGRPGLRDQRGRSRA